ncbi:MAG: ABC transporter permease [Gemmatimonadales bacterium]
MRGTSPIRDRTGDVLQMLAGLGLGLTLLAGFLGLAGFHVVPALDALWRGSFGSGYAFTSVALVHATPLIILGLAFTLGSKAGAINVGMEGQFAAGAIAATWAGTHAGGWPAVLAVSMVLSAGLLVGAAWIAVPVVLRARFGITEVISTLLLNFVGAAAVSYAVTGPLQEAGHTYPQSDPIATVARLPRLWYGTRLHLGFVLAIVIAVLLAACLQRTKWGFQLRAAGTGPRAAALMGRIPLTRVAGTALLWSGALAGLGGAVEVSGVSYALYQNLSPGYGFTAIAVALLGRLRPIPVLFAGVVFGALEAGAGAMQRDAGIPAVAVQVVEAVVIIVALLTAGRSE